MRLLFIAPSFLLASCSVFLGGSSVNLHGGVRQLTEGEGKLEDVPVIGLDATVGLVGGLAAEGAIFYSEEDGDVVGGFEPTLEQSELSLGARYTFLHDMPVRVYVGAGVNWIDAELDGLPSPSLSDDAVGGYLHGGVIFNIFAMQAGVDVRGAVTDTEINGENLDYLQATIFLGIGF